MVGQRENPEGRITKGHKDIFVVMGVFTISIVKLYALNVCSLWDISVHINMCVCVHIFLQLHETRQIVGKREKKERGR